VVPLATAFVASLATGMLAQATRSETFAEGIVLGLVVGVGYALTLTAVQETGGPSRALRS
jgi:Na+-translocating ferredoxin:NAD+ oxidoreductase RnfA subunit